MAAGPSNLLTRIGETWNSWPMSLRLALAIMAGGAIIAAALATAAWNQPTAKNLAPLLGGYDFSLDGRESAIKAFRAANLNDYVIVDSKILVPTDKEADYLAAVASAEGGLPGTTDAAIDKYIDEQRSWWASTAESARLFHIAEQRRLARVIESFPEIENASVIVSLPADRGTIRSRTPRGTAAVKISTVDGRPLAPQRVEQIKDLIDGAFTDVPGRDSVKVVEDALRSASLSGVNAPDPALLSEGAGQYLMTKAAFEIQIENKIRELFADLNGLLVKVNAELDPRHNRKQRVDMKEKGPLKRESSESFNSETAAALPRPAGEPGVRTNVDIPGQTPNQGASATARATPNIETQESVEREFENIATLTDQSFVDFEPLKVGVVVRYRIPPGAPDQADANPQSGPTPLQIREMIASLGYPGMSVDTVAVQPYVGEEPAPVELPAPSTLDTAAKWTPTIVYLLIGIAAIVIAIVLARRAPLPQIAETTDSAQETDSEPTSETGTNMPKDDAAIKFEQLQEQISKMVQTNPEVAAGFVRRWILDHS